ncbi:MAG TPA: hypothetical protein PKI64_05580 [Kiritimatiellia bacterium]|nr:hypothetical protein [Kiritimatiellia bacterium]HQM24239.1 hypothetical protein [Kiritimatiellia bacterium]
MKRMVFLALAWSLGATGSGAADVVSNAMSGVRYPSLATAVAAATSGDRLVMIGNETLGATLIVSNKTLTLVSDGTVRTVTGSTNCTDGMVSILGVTATLTLGQPEGSDAAPTLVFDGGRYQGVTSLSNMFFSDLGWLTIHPGVVLRNLASVDVGAIYNLSGVVEMYGGRIENNSAPYGGGIFNQTGDIWIYGGSITGNVAQIGGGIYNDAVQWFMGYIVGYYGKVDVRGGLIANNAANVAGGGILSYGALDLSGGQVLRNSAPQGGGVLHANGKAPYGMSLRGTAVVASNSATQGSGIYYNDDGNTWLTLAEGGRVEPSNDVFLAIGTSPVILESALTGRGLAARLTPAAYATNQIVLGASTNSNLWIVSNYYGKFTVTPAPGDPEPWYVNVNGRLSRDNSAATPATILSIASSETNVEWGVEPAFQAWDGVVELATNLVGQAWNFQPLAPEAYSVTNGRVVVPRDRPLGIYRLRTGGAGP